MTEKLFVTICEVLIGMVVVTALMIILIAAWYDFRSALSRKQLQRTSDRLRKSRQPFIAIVIYTHNGVSSIVQCLDAILTSRYINYRIVVANHKSTDTTRQIVKEYQKSHSKTPLTLYNASASLTHHEVIHRAIKKVPSSDFVMTLDQPVQITQETLRHAMARFSVNDHLTHLYLRENLYNESSIQTLTPQFVGLTKNIIYKALTVIRLLPFRSASRITITRQAAAPNVLRLYTSDITYSQNTLSLSSPRPIARLFGLIISYALIILTAGYWMWTAATLRSNLLLTLSWIVVTIWLIAVIWSDSIIKLSKKIELTVSVPFMYFIFYVKTIGDFFIHIWRLLKTVPFRNIAQNFQAELYSSRY